MLPMKVVVGKIQNAVNRSSSEIGAHYPRFAGT